MPVPTSAAQTASITDETDKRKLKDIYNKYWNTGKAPILKIKMGGVWNILCPAGAMEYGQVLTYVGNYGNWLIRIKFGVGEYMVKLIQG